MLQTTTTDVREHQSSGPPALCVGGPVTLHSLDFDVCFSNLAYSLSVMLIACSLKDYVRKLDPATNVGLNADSIDYYTVGEVRRRKGI